MYRIRGDDKSPLPTSSTSYFMISIFLPIGMAVVSEISDDSWFKMIENCCGLELLVTFDSLMKEALLGATF